MFIVWIVGYWGSFAALFHLVMSLKPPLLVVYAFAAAFFVGHFLVLGIAMAHEELGAKRLPFLWVGIRQGFTWFKGWFAYLAGMAVLAVVLLLLSGDPFRYL